MSPFIRVLLLVTLSMVIVVAHPAEARPQPKEDKTDSSKGYDDGITRLETALEKLLSLDDYIGAFIDKMKPSLEEDEVSEEKKTDSDRIFEEHLEKVDGLYIIFDSVMSNIEGKIDKLKENEDQKTDNGKTGANGVKRLIQPLQDYLQFAMK